MTALLSGVGSYVALTRSSETGSDADTDTDTPATGAQQEVPRMSVQNFQVAETIDELDAPETEPAVAVTHEGWVYQDGDTDGWKQFTLGTESTPIPFGHIERQRTRVSNGDAFAYPDEGSEGIQEAIDALGETGGRVRLQPGTYICDSQIRLDRDNVQLVGTGPGTQLLFAEGFEEDLIVVGPDAEYAGVRNVIIDGRGADNDGGSGIRLVGRNWAPVIEGVGMQNVPENGIAATSPTDEYTYEPVIRNVYIRNTGNHGLNLGWVADLYGANVYVESTGGIGLRLFGAGTTLFHPHVYDAQGKAGIYFGPNAQDARLIGAYVDRNARDGVYVTGNHVTVSSSYIFGNSRAEGNRHDGLVLDGARRCLVTNNVFHNLHDSPWQRYGVVERSGSSKNLVALNQFISNVEGGVKRESSSSDSTFSLNVT